MVTKAVNNVCLGVGVGLFPTRLDRADHVCQDSAQPEVVILPGPARLL